MASTVASGTGALAGGSGGATHLPSARPPPARRGVPEGVKPAAARSTRSCRALRLRSSASAISRSRSSKT
eukprot:4192961-Prymnesium_polylepis.1